MTSPTPCYHVWLVEPDAAYREALQCLLQHPGVFTCDEVFASAEALLATVDARCRTGCPNAVVLDIDLPRRLGTAVLSLLRAALPEARVVLFTRHEDTRQIFAALRQGASGYLLKHLPPRQILEVLHDAAQGCVVLSPPLARLMRQAFKQRARQPAPGYGLTLREREILQAMVEGDSQKEISLRLAIPVSDVNAHIRSLYHKLHALNK